MAKDLYDTEEYAIHLTRDEVYTLSLLLGRVQGDVESYDILQKLEDGIGRELTCDDYKRVVVKVKGEEAGDDWVIQID